MRIENSGLGICLVLLIGLMLQTGVVWTSESETHKKVAGMDVYIGMIPTEVIKGQDLSKEIGMHGGIPGGKGQYHLVVALFDSNTGSRITDAKIVANIAWLGLSGSTKKLESMKINEVVTFGNYFVLPGNTPYRIRLTLHVPGKAVSEALFEFSNILR